MYFQELLNEYKEHWYQSKTFSKKEEEFKMNKRTQRDNDIRLTKLVKLIIEQMESKNVNEKDDVDEDLIKNLLFNEVKKFMVDVLRVQESTCDRLFTDHYYKSTKEFIDLAKAFNQDISFEDIYQALRNVWVINSLQIYLDEPIQVTKSVFAYSMLYPLTDNFLDDPSVSSQEKEAFNIEFHRKIRTGLSPENGIDKQKRDIYHMIDLIYEQYPMIEYPQVSQSLLAILDGQSRSLFQQNLPSLYSIDLLEYTFYKGGTSVLADAYLVRGALSKEEALVAYGYGVILQMADDLQDIREDIENHHATMMNTQSRFSKLDGLIEHYESFIHYYFLDIYKADTLEKIALKDLLTKSVSLLLMSGIYSNLKFFSRKFQKLEKEKGVFSARGIKKVNGDIPKIYSLVGCRKTC